MCSQRRGGQARGPPPRARRPQGAPGGPRRPAGLAAGDRPGPGPPGSQPAPVRPGGLRVGGGGDLAPFSLLVGVNALVGGMVAQERTVLSLLATEVFGLAAVSAALT